MPAGNMNERLQLETSGEMFDTNGETLAPPAPRSPKAPPAAFVRPDEVCDNPSCKETRRVERTIVTNLKHEVASLKMQLSQLTQNLGRKAVEAEAETSKAAEFEADLHALRTALEAAAHAHGTSIAETSSQIAALQLKLTRSEQEVTDMREKRKKERGRAAESGAALKTAVLTITELDLDLTDMAEKMHVVDVSQRDAGAELEKAAEKQKYSMRRESFI
ncbi:hypothetical protein T492DRAFT_840012 [Pavlovales sp. CCMP2436]|nr:hypothetical protein T492DRAFT_840012 [Pavlovales sp. CCMP2436]